jgi:hypothetical protein
MTLMETMISLVVVVCSWLSISSCNGDSHGYPMQQVGPQTFYSFTSLHTAQVGEYSFSCSLSNKHCYLEMNFYRWEYG